MSEKSKSIGLRVSETQRGYLQKMVDSGQAKSLSDAVQQLINKAIIGL